jgi:outer membrane usher protein
MINYETVGSRGALLEAPKLGGGTLLFGASVEYEQSKSVGVIDQESRIFACGLEDQEALTVKWESGPVEQCRIAYTLPKKDPKAYRWGYLSVQSHCVPGSETVANAAGQVSHATVL